MPSIAVDTGPLIALFDRDDRQHKRALQFFKGTHLPLVTNARGTLTGFLGWVGEALEIDLDTKGDLARISEIIAKYRDLPADFADASLVALCERRGIERIATLDKDFDVYRTGRRKRLTNVFCGDV